MASGTPSAGLDTMITVKVQFDGVTRRAKMPLRDMIPKTLESRIRTFLHLPSDAEAVFERYSDSAAAYVVLDPENIPIYKQLYRAAKAKSKLKIRVTIQNPEQKSLPKPVSVEDEPEATPSPAAAESPLEDQTTEQPQEIPEETHADANSTPSPVTESAVSTSSATAVSETTTLPYRGAPISKAYNSTLLSDAARFIGEREDSRRDFESRLANLMDSQSIAASRLATQQAERRARLAQQATSGCCRPTDSLQNLWSGSAVPPLPTAVSYPATCPATGAAFAVCCNSCEKTIPDVHFHCATCDDGDFDLCQSCVQQGITCHGKDHWLIKRTTVDGRLIQSTTETVAPKVKAKEVSKPVVKVETKIETKIEPKDEVPSLPKPTFEPLIARWASIGIRRTCNCCVRELPEQEFLHCDHCEDYDLCQPCFAKNAHGHHPKHGFSPAVKGTEMPQHIKAKMQPGRNQMHHAICDGCEKYITGVRHKCLDCPDWDYCVECAKDGKFTHPGHRFIPIYEQLSEIRDRTPAPVHVGICCDGPLCASNEAYPAYIRGTRYKCAVCNDMDFCANCEASPVNGHNKTHPMIMFKTPVRHVSVTTTGEHQDGQRMPTMGDRIVSDSRTTEIVTPVGGNTINAVQTIVDMKPSEPAPAKLELQAPTAPVKKAEPEIKQEKKKEIPIPAPAQKPSSEQGLNAVFVRDTIVDGSVLPPNHVFEQTWILRNEGKVAWPAGCSVKFVGGDYMGHVDPNHPAGISELVSASESTVCYSPLAPGQEFPFTVLLRTPARPGKVVSYWRLTSPSGHKFGHRLWCDVSVRNIKTEEPVKDTKKTEDSQASSQMIFPKLEKESPVASIHEAVRHESAAVENTIEPKEESCDEEWDLSEDGFMTDEEYDILDASDEEYLEDQKKKVAAK